LRGNCEGMGGDVKDEKFSTEKERPGLTTGSDQ
jgi:hypothetical protein